MIFLEVVGRTWAAFRAHWKLFLALHLGANLFVAAVFGPLLSGVIGWLVLASGDAALTDQDILRAFVSPLGFLCFGVGLALVVSVSVFETAALMMAAWRLQRGKRVSLLGLGGSLLRRFPVIFRLALRMVFQVLLLASPFLALAGWIGLRFLGEFDINYYLSARPPVFWQAGSAIVLIVLVMGLLLLRLVSGWVLALPLLLLGHGGPDTVLGRSRTLVAPRRAPVFLFLGAWGLAFVAALALASGLLDLGATALVAVLGPSLRALAWLTAGLFLAWSALNFFIGLFAIVSLVLALLHFYQARVGAPPTMAGVEPDFPGAAPNGRPAGRWVVVGLALLAVAGLAGVPALLDALRQNPAPEVIAHRGASFDAPENTLASIQAAIDQGADWVEIDVQETRAGDILVIHDRDLMKVGGVPLTVRDTPLETLRAVDIGSYRDPRFADQRVPLLSEVLALAKGRVRVNIELKYYGREERLEERVAALVEAHGMADQVVLMSLSLPGVRAMKALRPAWSVGLLSSVALGDVTRLDADFFAVNAGFASRAFIDRAHRRGKRVMAWTVNDPAGMSAMMSKGVDGIITDRPALAREVLARRSELAPHERLLVLFASRLGSDFGEAP